MSFKVTALVPMKGHSERIPNKNLRLFRGQPLCTWIVATLRAVPEIAQVVVNTDSPAIAFALGDHADVVIHWRPEHLQGDMVSMNRIIEHDLASVGPEHEHFLQTHATNPLVRAETVRQAVSLYRQGLPELDSLFSVTRHQARFYQASGQPLNHDPQDLKRTQDLEPIFEENSNFYLFSRASFTACQHRIGRHPQLFEMSPLEAVDIDVESDWHLAEQLMAVRERGGLK